MREIKFRVWDKKHKKMSLVDAIDFEHDEIYGKNGCERYTPKPFKDIELMQYTGLTDKNGKEIYEGDIVEVWSFVRWIGFIKYLPEKAAFVLWDYEKFPYLDDFVYLSQFEDGFEILGNIFENPELMEVSNDK